MYMKRIAKNTVDEFENIHTAMSDVLLDGEQTIRVVKADKIMQFDENTLVRLKDCDFHNGTIKVKMLSRLLPDAPDFARGFIKAEVVNYRDLLDCGSYAGAREKGLVRMEGKDYVVQDGDVILFRFNV